MDFSLIKNEILGKDYDLSVAFVGPKKSREINKIYRNKDKPTNVLSFPFSKKSGEIILCKAVIKKEMKKFGKNFNQMVLFLVIHGMLHLKGMKHSAKMEEAEKKYEKKYFHRHRHWILYDKSHSGRISKRRKKS